MNQDYWKLLGSLAGAMAGSYGGDVSGGMQLGGALGGAVGGAMGTRPTVPPSMTTTQQQRPQPAPVPPPQKVGTSMPGVSTMTPFTAIDQQENPLAMPPEQDMRLRHQQLWDPRIAYLAGRL